MKIKQLAQKTGTSFKHVWAICRGKARASTKLAKALENVTGISRLAWLYPEEFHNPLIEEFQNTYKGKREKGLPNVRKLTSVK